MAEYKSNYTGLEIDTAIGLANTALQAETDPIFSASASANITSEDITNWNGKSDFSGSYNDLTDKPTIPDVSNFITKDVNDLTYYELKTAVGNSIVMSIDSSTYVLTVSLKNSAGTVLNTQTVDLPLETMVVGGSYDSTNKKIILTLKNGQTIEFSVADLVSGLQSEITSNNKLSADLVDDTSTTNKFVSASDKTTWDGKYTKPIAGIPSTDLAEAVQTSLGKADTALQSETYTGTKTKEKMNGSTVASSGEADLGTVLTQHQDISGKQDIIQYSTMPTASSETVGKIVQFTGTTDSTYTNGYFYIGAGSSGSYSWTNLPVQASGSNIAIAPINGRSITYPFDFSTAQAGIYVANSAPLGTSDMKFYYKITESGSVNEISLNLFVLSLSKSFTEASSGTVFGTAFGIKRTADSDDGKLYMAYLQKQPLNQLNFSLTDLNCKTITNNNQSISGAKTFSEPPKTTSAPTNQYHLTNKKYVDDLVGNINTILATLTTPSNGGNE